MIELSQDAALVGQAIAPDAHAARRARDAVNTPAFHRLVEARRRIVVPLLGVSLAYIFAMTLLAGYGKPLMAIKVWGAFNLGYLMVLATYLLCWVVAVIYVRVANRTFEALGQEAVAEVRRGTAS